MLNGEYFPPNFTLSRVASLIYTIIANSLSPNKQELLSERNAKQSSPLIKTKHIFIGKIVSKCVCIIHLRIANIERLKVNSKKRERERKRGKSCNSREKWHENENVMFEKFYGITC
jgi:hypothetical protein